MVAVVGVAALIRRGWRAAAFHVLPLGVVYSAWWLHYGRGASPTDFSLVDVWDWTRTGISGAFDSLGEVPFVGWALAALLIIGLVLAWRDGAGSSRRRRLAASTAMLAGAGIFLVTSGINRVSLAVDLATSSRYMHIVVALLMPGLAVAADVVIRRWRASAFVVVVLLLIGIPGNIRQTGTNFPARKTFEASEQLMRTLPRLPLAARVPRNVRPELVNAPWVTVGWLRDAAGSGRLPAASRPPTRGELATYEVRLSIDQQDGGTATSCQPLTQPVDFDFTPGQSFVVRGTIAVASLGDEPGTSSLPVAYGASLLSGGGLHTLKNVGLDLSRAGDSQEFERGALRIARTFRLMKATSMDNSDALSRLRQRYIDTVEHALTHTLYRPLDIRWEEKPEPEEYAGSDELREAAVRELSQANFDWAAVRADGRDWPYFAQTMVGEKRLANVRSCVEQVVTEGVPGDLIETGVWRGGVVILMRAILEAYGDASRSVYVADSFEGVPPPNVGEYPSDTGSRLHDAKALAVSREEVARNFELYGLLDDRVRFLEGWFKDTLPNVRDRTWSVVRLDGDLYESTMDALVNLYPGLSVGGFLIVDDYGHGPCREAVTRFREEYGIDEPIEEIDWLGAFWRRAH